jgi:hypothetical protein
VERELGFVLDGRENANESSSDGARAGCRVWQGSRWTGGFRLAHHLPSGSRSMVVVASGKVRPVAAGSQVRVTLRPPLPLTLSLVIGLPLLTLLAVAVSAAAIVRHEPVVLLIWTMPSVVWTGIVRPFSLHAQLAEDFLRKLFPPPVPPGAGPFR